MRDKLSDKKPVLPRRTGQLFPYFLTALALLVGSYKLFDRTIPDIHDLNVFLWAQAIHETSNNLIGLPQWLSTMWYGFGLPVFYYYNPFYYLVTEFFQGIGLGTVLSVKMTAFMAFPLGFFGLYLWARQYVKNLPALVGSLIFVLSPYFLSLIYVRGALPEALALSMLPWLLYFSNRWVNTTKYPYWLGLTLVATLLILTHTLTALIGAALLGAYLTLNVIWNRSSIQTWALGLSSGLAALALSAWYWLPAYANLSAVNPEILTGDKFFYGLNFPEFGQVFGPTLDASRGWLILGLIPTAILLLGWIAFREILHPSHRARLVMTLVFATVFVFLVLPFSDFLWNAAPPLELFQFPIRFLGPALLWLGLAGALLLEIFITDPKAQSWTATVVIVVIGGLALPFTPLKPHHLIPNMTEQDLNGYRYIERVAVTDPDNGGVAKIDRGLVAFEYLPRKLSEKEATSLLQKTIGQHRDQEDDTILIRPKKLSGPDGLTITMTQETYGWVTADLITEKAATLTINQFEFFAWHYFLDGQEVHPEALKEVAGQSLEIPAGTHKFEMRLEEIPYQRTSRLISLLALLLTMLSTLVVFVRRPRL